MSYTFTPSQEKVLDLYGKNTLKACPGSGKTFIMAHKVIKDLHLWKQKNAGMAVLSFTNVAKNELLEKIRKIGKVRTLPYPHFLGTLDSFISQYIFSPFAQHMMNIDKRPCVVEPEFVTQYSTYFWKGDCIRRQCDPNDFYIDVNKKVHDIKANFSNCPVTYYKPCKKMKLSMFASGYATYNEALLIAIEILKKEKAILNLLVKKFPYFIVDEAQDTSSQQMELLNLLFDNGVKDVFLIGDPDQAIYEWRDADPTVFTSMYKKTGWNPIMLNENFRSSQHICNATQIFSSLNNASTATGESYDCDIKPIIMRYDSKDKNSAINNFLDLCDKHEIKATPDNVVVLSRGRVSIYDKDYSKIDDLWQTPLSFYLAKATYHKGEGEVEQLMKLLEKVIFNLLFDYKEVGINYTLVHELYTQAEWNLLLYKLATALPQSATSLRVWKGKILEVLNNFVEENNLTLSNKFEIKTKSSVRAKQYTDIKDFLDAPIRSFFINDYKNDYLHTTIHAVKGCTYDAVMLILQTTGKLTSNMLNTYPIDSEEIRTFYVAATRARKLFVLAIPSTIKPSSLVRFPGEHWDNYNSTISL